MNGKWIGIGMSALLLGIILIFISLFIGMAADFENEARARSQRQD